jgi:hypothetical protein
MSNNNIQINYGGVNLFNGIAPTPFVFSNQEFSDFKTKWNQITQLTMEGQLTGRYVGELSHGELIKSFETLLSRLKNNFQPLVITENNQTIFFADKVVVDNIDIPDSRWYGVLPFTIDFIVYQQNLFSQNYGIVDPSETLNFNDGDDQIISLTHTISAKGFQTSTATPIQNAKNWVTQRTGNYNKIIPILVNTNQGSNFILDSVRENIDRFNGEYSWEAVYTRSKSNESPSNCFLNYTIDMNSGINDGYITANINGSLEKNSLSILRTEYDNINFYNYANNAALSAYFTTLNVKPIEQSVTESQDENKLEFSISYNNDFSSDVINNYTVQINEDSIKNITTVSLDTTITAKYGDAVSRWNKVQDFYNNNFNAYNLANTEYIKEVTNRALYTNKLTESITFDEYNSQIQYSASWSNKRQAFSDNVLNLRSSTSLTPSVNIYIPHTSAFTPKEHNVQNFKCANRTILEIEVSATAKPNPSISIDVAKSTVNNELNRVKNNFGVNSSNRLLEDRVETIDNNLKIFTVKERWLIEGTIYDRT